MPYKIRASIGAARFLPVACLASLVACAGPSLPDGQPGTPEAWAAFLDSGSSSRTDADWNDIDAAVAVAASRVEMAVVSANSGPRRTGQSGDTRQRLFELKTVRDEPAWIMVTRAQGPADPSPFTDGASASAPDPTGADTLLIRAKVGRFGDRQRETALLNAISRRLAQLKGRDSAPIQ